MGFQTSAWYKARIIEIEEKIAEELDLAGVKQTDNGKDRIEFHNDRLKLLEDRKMKYEQEYENALAREGSDDALNFIPRRLTGN